MAAAITCLSCRHRFEYAGTTSGFVACPACRILVPIVPPVREEHPAIAEALPADGQDEPTDALEEVQEVEAVADNQPRGAAASDSIGPELAAAPSTDLLRARDFTIVRTGRALAYDIRDTHSDAVLGAAQEAVTAGDRLLRTFVMSRAQMEGTLLLTAASGGSPLLHIQRGKLQGVLALRPCVVQLWRPDERLLAWFEAGAAPARWGFGAIGDFWNADVAVYDGRDREWAAAEGPKYHRPDWQLRARGGEVLARVRGEGTTSPWFPSGISWTAQKGRLRVTLFGRAADDPAWKLALLGAALAYEYIISSIPLPRPPRI
jgi:hypothetical protein